MEATAPLLPKFRDLVTSRVEGSSATISVDGNDCTFDFPEEHRSSIAALFDDLRRGGFETAELGARAPKIADAIPALLAEFDRLRLLTDSGLADDPGARTGAQLYREVRRAAERIFYRDAKSSFYRALVGGDASREQLIGYALEYFWLVKMAPGLIAPALASAASAAERNLLQGFLKSELGHDAFLGKALASVGIPPDMREAYQPLTATFALGASLGVYSRQHPLSFAASLFLFERAQPQFIDAFDARCIALGLPASFYGPLRRHADLNDDYDHEDISRALLALQPAVSGEECGVVIRHVILLAETMVRQEEEILALYSGEPGRFGGNGE